jgi:hypothetical protein
MKNYRLRITLEHIEPAIWREVVVPGAITLAKLHTVIQICMGWENYHIYLFEAGRLQYGEGTAEWSDFGQRVMNAKRTLLEDVAPRKGATFLYTYDMGDGWSHKIRVGEVKEGTPEKIRCLAGARSCPPEDCGGPYGYQELLEIIFDPKHPEHQERKEWLGDGFEPEAFDPEAVNRRLARLKPPTQAA